MAEIIVDRVPHPTSHQFVDRTGMRYGRLTVLHYVGRHGTMTKWLCRCDCGALTSPGVAGLTTGNTTSCGCWFKERASKRRRTHGEAACATRSLTYKIWAGMRNRCLNPKNKDFNLYGGRGITVDPVWDNYIVFLADMGERPLGLSIDRIDNNGPYSKNNCRWTDARNQAKNMRTNVWIETSRGRMIVSDIARIAKVSSETMRARLRRGWSGEELFSAAGQRHDPRPQPADT